MRRCDNARISLTLFGLSAKLLSQISYVELPGIVDLTVFMSGDDQDQRGSVRSGGVLTDMRSFLALDAARREAAGGSIWTVVFSGSSFPDLRKVYVNTMVESPSQMPSNLIESFTLANRPDFLRQRQGARHDSPVHPSTDGSVDYAAVNNMRQIKLELNSLLDARMLRSLFGTNMNLSQLTKLEIVNCPLLHPIIDIEAISAFLQQALKQVRFLKLHLIHHHDGHHGYKIAYTTKITKNPKHHLCHIVREFGENIPGLDIAVPFACRQMFMSKRPTSHESDSQSPKFPDILEPSCTLPDRLIAAGYRYRRLIFNDFCSEASQWDEMASTAALQIYGTTWELLYNSGESFTSAGVWAMDGCLLDVNVDEVLQRPFNQ